MAFLGISLFGTSAAAAAPAEPDEASRLFALRRTALDLAAATARHENRQPTLADYITAAESLRGQVETQGLQWGPRVYANLSGQTIRGFLIRREDIDAAPPEFQTNLSFERSIFDETVFRPATSYEPERSQGASFTNVTFDGMGEGDLVVLKRLENGRGGDIPYQDISFTHIQGGVITIDDGANIQGLSIAGATAHLDIGRAVISRLEATDAHLLSFTAARGAQFNTVIFNGATIAGNSQLTGTVWNNATFNGTNLDSVDLSGAQLTNVSFVGAHVTNMNLSGARLNGVSFVDVDLSALQFDANTRLTNVTVNGHTFNSPEALRAYIAAQSVAAPLQSAVNAAAGMTGGITGPVLTAFTIDTPRPAVDDGVPPALANVGVQGGETATQINGGLNSALPVTEEALALQEDRNAAFAATTRLPGQA